MRSRDVLLILLLAGGGFTATAQEDVPEVAQRKLDEANRHREAGRAEEAIARYREVIDSAPNVIEAYIGLGALYHESEQYERALEVFGSGLERFPSDATLLFNIAATEARLERFDDALAHADSAIKAGGEDAAIFSLRGTILRRLGRQAEAVDSFRKAAALDSKNARAHYNLGNVLYELGRKEEALGSFAQAIKLDKDFQPAHYNLGAVLFDLARFDEALKAYEVALAPVEKDFARGREVAPVHARAYLNLGAIFLQRQSWDRALDAYGKAARLDPSLAAAQYNVGFILYHLGRNPEAYQAYQRAVKLDPALPLSYLHMGLIDFGAGRMENAARWLEEGLPKLSGKDRKEAFLALGPAYRALGDLTRAVASYRAALQEDGNEVSALVGLGRLLRQQGELSEARPLLEKAGEIVLDGSGVALELAALAKAEGDSARERAMYEEALRRDGDRPEMWPVRVNLAAAMVRSGDVRDARLQMEMLLKQGEAIRASSPDVMKELRTAYALLCAREGNLPVARRELEAVLSGDPAFAPAVNAGAAIDAIEGDVDKASTSLRGILGRSGGSTIDSLVRANFGQALWLSGRYDEAREPLLAAAEAFPENVVVRSALGEIALRRGDHAGAVRDLGAAVEACKGGRGTAPAKEPSTRLELFLSGTAASDAPCARARRALAIALVGSAGEKLGDAQGRREAHRLASEAIALGVDGAALAQALFLRGTVELLEGQDARARADLEKALASGLAESLKATARNNLGVALYRMGAMAEAQRQFEQARAASPKTAPSVLNLAIAYHDAREPEKALALYDEYVALGGRRGEDARKWAEGIRRVYR